MSGRMFRLAVFIGFATSLAAQNRTHFAGVYDALDYAYGQRQIAPGPLTITTGNITAGVNTITLETGSVQLGDGTTFSPLNTSIPVAVGSGTANSEIVTPTALQCFTPLATNTCRMTATFTKAHGPGELITSSSFGLYEAMAAAFGANGGVAEVTGSWFRAGGTNAMIAAAPSFANVGIGNNSTGGVGGTGTVSSGSTGYLGYYPSPGTTIAGATLLQYSPTSGPSGTPQLGLNVALSAFDYQVSKLQLNDTGAAPNCFPTCTPANNTFSSMLLNVNSTPDSVMANLYPQQVGFNVLMTSSAPGGVGTGKGIESTVLTHNADGLAGQFNATMDSAATGLIAIGIDATAIDNNQAGAGGVGNPGTPVGAQNLIPLEGDVTVTSASTTNAFNFYCNNQASIFQAPGSYCMYGGTSNGTTAAGRFVPNATPLAAGIVLDNGLTSGVAFWGKSTASGATGTISCNGTAITSTGGANFASLWGVNNTAGSTLGVGNNQAGNVDQMYITGGSCTPGQYTVSNVLTATTLTLTGSAGTGSGSTWSMVGPSQTIELTAQNAPNVTCTGNCSFTEALSSGGVLSWNAPNSFNWQLGGPGSAVNSASLSNGTGSLVNLIAGTATMAGQLNTNNGGGFINGWGANPSATASSTLQGFASITTALNAHLVALSVGTNGTGQLSDGGLESSYAPLASPTFTGSPAAPTESICDNSTKLATDAFVLTETCLVQKAAGSPFTVPALSGTWFASSGSAYTFTLPTATNGLRQCFANYSTLSTVITLTITGTLYYKGVAKTTSLASSGALGDYLCIDAASVSNNVWIAEGAGQGTWTGT